MLLMVHNEGYLVHFIGHNSITELDWTAKKDIATST